MPTNTSVCFLELLLDFPDHRFTEPGNREKRDLSDLAKKLLAKAKQVVKQAACVAALPLIGEASDNNGVLALGAGGSFTVGNTIGIAGTGTVQFAASSSGEIGLTATLSGNPGVPPVAGRSAIGGLAISSSTATTLNDFAGGSISASSGAGPVQGSVSISNTSVTTTVLVGRGVGSRSIAVEAGKTSVLASTDCKEVALDAFIDAVLDFLGANN